jgi:8-oxo-dGTP pyrophosphatase MutT (NUDIX family)
MAEIDRYTGLPESPADTATREFIEETFVRPMEIMPLGVVRNEDGTDFHVFLGIFDDEFMPRLNWENDRWMWIDLGDLLMLRNKHHGLDRLLRDQNVFDLLVSFS